MKLSEVYRTRSDFCHIYGIHHFYPYGCDIFISGACPIRCDESLYFMLVTYITRVLTKNISHTCTVCFAKSCL